MHKATKRCGLQYCTVRISIYIGLAIAGLTVNDMYNTEYKCLDWNHLIYILIAITCLPHSGQNITKVIVLHGVHWYGEHLTRHTANTT